MYRCLLIYDVVGHHVGSLPILLYREFVLGFFLFTVFYQGVWGSGLPGTWITFFTNWSFVAMALYSVIGIAVSAKGYYQKGAPSPIWQALDKAFVIVYVTAASNAIFLTAFYWVVIYEPEGTLHLDNVFRHGVNVVVMLGELIISRLPIVSYHLQIPIAFTSVYAVFFWVYRGASGVWVYEALNWSKTSSILYYTVLPILITLSFYLLYLVAHLRERFARKPFKGFQEAKIDDGIELAEV
ncbi:hypothetical protein BSKO_08865 [Bryopsis sp. KO-2023]|nr:hypothetical protein BSKO_08865 [Bryopsis sp. KO-2023]